jgi:Tol biopolymer transport system component
MQPTMRRVVLPRAVQILALIALLVAALLVAALVVGSRHPTPPPFGLARTGMLVYDRDGDIYVRGVDGQSRPLLEGQDFLSTPIWARDGSRFAFWSGGLGERGELRSADATGQDVRTLATGVVLPSELMSQAVSWSPDGTRVVFSSGDGIMEAVDSDGTDRHAIGSTPPLRFDPAWSPDGALIAFRRQASTSSDAPRQVFVIRPDGSGERQVSSVTEEPNSALAPNWSFDGRLLYDAVFGPSLNGNHGDIVVASPQGDGWSERIVVGGQTTDWFARWSNDARRIVFLRSPSGGEGDLYIADADGSDLAKLSDRVMSTGGACWSPDDRLVVSLTGEEGKPIEGQPGATYVVFEANSGKVLQEIPAPGVHGIIDCSWQRLAP